MRSLVRELLAGNFERHDPGHLDAMQSTTGLTAWAKFQDNAKVGEFACPRGARRVACVATK